MAWVCQRVARADAAQGFFKQDFDPIVRASCDARNRWSFDQWSKIRRGKGQAVDRLSNFRR